ncbi:MAG TPA: helix-turn-helix domain-containing protein [Pseudonocardia sp.]|jgi:AcrR family transcriptional regulator|nr:helix-turn-helix domain-containing protein [Pseudonocardia sp.]
MTSDVPTTAAALPPARGTRPRNRAALILAASTYLFCRRGYSNVGMADIAEAVAIRPSALYRHFPGKQQLLGEVVLGTLAEIRALVDGLAGTDREVWLPALAELALDNRRIGVLWRRESRHLAAEDRARMRTAVAGVRSQVAALTLAARPDLGTAPDLGTVPDGGAALAGVLSGFLAAALLSVSYHGLGLPRREFARLLTELATTVLDAELPADLATRWAGPARPVSGGVRPRSRREALLVEATRMFAERGFAEVGLDDIGAPLGLTGAAIYHHFPTKLTILQSAFHRGNEWLWAEFSQAMAAATDQADALRGLLRSYGSFAVHHADLINLLIREGPQLPVEDQRPAYLSQHAYLDEWVELALAVHPAMDPVAARIRVHAVLTVANEVAGSRRLRQHPAALDTLQVIGAALLRLSPDGAPR